VKLHLENRGRPSCSPGHGILNPVNSYHHLSPDYFHFSFLLQFFTMWIAMLRYVRSE
jgi:hypothetical protein